MLRAGGRLGPYEVVGPLGAGGMGEVYHAWDDRLRRAVALKVLPSDRAGDRQRLQRFVREARIGGLLNHPNLLAIYDVGGIDEVPYLVSELLEGESLRERLRRGPLPLKKAVELALQMAAGLAAIHDAGIVHHDLKPENLFLTREGLLKILDFGLARPAACPEPDEPELETLTTLADAEQGVSGTVAYLAPEQLQGIPADHRSDLFALGAILLEMLTGVPAFGRASRRDMERALLEDDPLTVFEDRLRHLPPELRRVLAHSLEKAPEARFQSARDLAFALGAGAPEAETPPRPPGRAESGSRARGAMPWAVAAIATLLALALWMRSGEPAAVAPVARAVLPLEGLYSGDGVAIAPDGRQIVYVGAEEKQRRLFVRAIGQLAPEPIPGTQNATGPFFSPDGEWVGFFADGRLNKVALRGGPPQVVCGAPRGSGGSWGADGTILFTPGVTEGVWRVPASGGIPAAVTTPDRGAGEKSHRLAEWLPGGRWALFYNHPADIVSLDGGRIELLSLESGERRVLIEGGHNARYAASGHLVYARGASLLAAPFDAADGRITGPPVEVVRGVRPSLWGEWQYGISTGGLLVYAPGGPEAFRKRLVWVDRRGRIAEATEREAEYRGVSLSRDGRRVAVRVAAANDQLWLHDFDRQVWTRLTSEWDSIAPIWTPDARHITVASSRTGVWNLFSAGVDEGGPEHRLLPSDQSQRPSSWSPDGRYLAFTQDGAGRATDIWIWDRERGAAVPFLRTAAAERDAKFSPDGRWLAYGSNESGRSEIYVRAFPGPGPGWQVSSGGGTSPLWAGNGREIFYRTTGGAEAASQVVSVPVTAGKEFRAGAPVALFDAGRFGAFDVTPDGSRFLMVCCEDPAPQVLHLVSGWFQELERTVSTGNPTLPRHP